MIKVAFFFIALDPINLVLIDQQVFWQSSSVDVVQDASHVNEKPPPKARVEEESFTYFF